MTEPRGPAGRSTGAKPSLPRADGHERRAPAGCSRRSRPVGGPPHRRSRARRCRREQFEQHGQERLERLVAVLRRGGSGGAAGRGRATAALDHDRAVGDEPRERAAHGVLVQLRCVGQFAHRETAGGARERLADAQRRVAPRYASQRHASAAPSTREEHELHALERDIRDVQRRRRHVLAREDARDAGIEPAAQLRASARAGARRSGP